MVYLVDPARACMHRYKGNSCNINTINNCMSETIAAFNGVPSNNAFTYPEHDAWEKTMNDIKISMGKDPVDLRISEAPVFVQTPHYFPNFLVNTNNKMDAYKNCIATCNTNNKKDLITCHNNCATDYNSIIDRPTINNTKKVVERFKFPTKENYTHSKDDDDNAFVEVEEKDTTIFWLSSFLSIFIAITILYMFYKSMTT